jgi:hypothetical protein
MGWNEARLTLTPKRWRRTVAKVKKMRGGVERDFFVAYPELIADSTASPLLPATVRDEVLRLGGEVREESVKLLDSVVQGITVLAFIESGEVAELELTFTLMPDSPRLVPTWHSFVEQLCQVLGVDVWDPISRSKTDSHSFNRLLASTHAWTDFQANYGWDNIDHDVMS